jgi:hypothetical protein
MSRPEKRSDGAIFSKEGLAERPQQEVNRWEKSTTREGQKEKKNQMSVDSGEGVDGDWCGGTVVVANDDDHSRQFQGGGVERERECVWADERGRGGGEKGRKQGESETLLPRAGVRLRCELYLQYGYLTVPCLQSAAAD